MIPILEIPQSKLSETEMAERDLEIADLIDTLESQIGNPSQGLPRDVFLFVSRLTPMINVDLLVKNAKKETLLTWRKDEYYAGWHVPGGIVRFKETIMARIGAVAKGELGASVEFGKAPLAMIEQRNPTRDTRGHFISLLYGCTLTSSLNPTLEYKTGPVKNGQWAWHAGCPENLISVHEVYRKFIVESSQQP